MQSADGRAIILFSGGDAPGMNALLRGIVRLGLNRHHIPVLGVKDGYAGLVRTCRRVFMGHADAQTVSDEIGLHKGSEGLRRTNQEMVWMDHASVSGILTKGGIVLGTSRCMEIRDPDVRRQVIDLLDDLDVATMFVCGGDGSCAAAACLALESSIQIVCVPATIDNDLPMTDTCIGVDTAINTVAWAIDHFNDTAGAHHRIMVLETMGRRCGYLARLSALASGAEIVVTPERGPLGRTKMQALAQRIETSLLRGRRHAIVLVAEGVRTEPASSQCPAITLTRSLQDYFHSRGGRFSGLEIRSNVLGHLQRGGRPTAADRILAAQFAEAAWRAVVARSGKSGVLACRNGRISIRNFSESFDGQIEDRSQDVYFLQKALSKC